MKQIIYALPTTDKIVSVLKSNISFDKNISPKLIKLGFNHTDNQIDLLKMISNPYHKVGLNFDFDNNNKVLKEFNIKTFNRNMAITWELLSVFNLLNVQNIYSNHNDSINMAEHIYKKKFLNKIPYKVYTKLSDIPKKNKLDLVYYQYSDIDIDENSALSIIIGVLPELLKAQNTNCNMILQLFGTQTQPTSELIYYLSSLYTESYLIKPLSSSELSDEKYLILKNMKEIPIKSYLELPKYNKNSYLATFGLRPPMSLINIIQCMNSYLIPLKYHKYSEILAYLNTKVYEGVTYQDFKTNQDKMIDFWINTFTDLELIRIYLEDAINLASKNCIGYDKLKDFLENI